MELVNISDNRNKCVGRRRRGAVLQPSSGCKPVGTTQGLAFRAAIGLEGEVDNALEELLALIADERATREDLLRKAHHELRKGHQPTVWSTPISTPTRQKQR